MGAATLAFSACKDEGNGAGTGDGSGGSTGTSGETGDGGATGDTGGSSGATDTEPPPRLYARGVNIANIEANQAVGVAIGADGEPVGPTERNAPLLQNRRTMIRGFWTDPTDDWEPRVIEAELTITYDDGETEVYTDEKLVEGYSAASDLNQAFVFGVESDRVLPGMKYQVSLFEVDQALADTPEPDPLPITPLDSPTYVGIETSYQTLRVVVVPVAYDDGAGCSTLVDLTDDQKQLFHDFMFMMNPVEEVGITWHDALVWNNPLDNFSQLNSHLSGLRSDENARPETYYYGLVDVCASSLGDAGGQAYGIPDTDPPRKDQAYQRVSSGLWLGNNVEWSAETFVHEVGHSQGRRHVAGVCGSEGIDPRYPDPTGNIGDWGFGVLDFGLRHPTVYKDYMTYCSPTWVSTWGYNQTYPVIRELSQWELEDHEPPGSLLVGTFDGKGGSWWTTVRGGVRDHELDPRVQVRFNAGADVIFRSPAAVNEHGHGPGYNIAVRLPDRFDQVTSVDLSSPEGDVHVARERIRLHHPR